MNCNSCENTTTRTTIEDFLVGCVGGYPIEPETIKYILAKCEIVAGTELSLMTIKQRDMCEIEMLRYILRAPGMTSSKADANGTWSHKDGAVELNSIDKKNLKAQLNELEKKYGLKKSSIQVNVYGMKVNH